MIEMVVIIGVSMSIVNTFKEKLPSHIVPLASVAIAIVLNILNAFIFGYSMPEAGKDALYSAGVLVGMFASSDLIVNRKSV